MFGRRKQEQQEEAAREAERRALFEELAKRPDTVCPFLGLENARTEYRDRVSDGHRCYAFGDPAELSGEQQQKVCLQRGYGNCPRYLRGVLVIPTEELEALRRPQPAPPPAAPAPVPAAAASGGGGRRGVLVVALLLLVALGGGGAAFLVLSGNGGIASQSPTPLPSASPTGVASATATGETPAASPTSGQSSPTPIPTPVVLPSIDPSTSAFPTPGPGDVPTGYIVVVQAGDYPVVRMDEDGTITGEATARFADVSGAPVSRVEVDGIIYWRTLLGEYTGLAYARALSRDFVVYETFENEVKEARFRRLNRDEY